MDPLVHQWWWFVWNTRQSSICRLLYSIPDSVFMSLQLYAIGDIEVTKCSSMVFGIHCDQTTLVWKKLR